MKDKNLAIMYREILAIYQRLQYEKKTLSKVWFNQPKVDDEVLFLMLL